VPNCAARCRPHKAPDISVERTIGISSLWLRCVAREELAGRARDENWSHEEYLAALLQRQVADRESAGTMMARPHRALSAD
jgi:hypothetical protein